MTKSPEAKSTVVLTRITPTLSIALEERCKALEITQADFLRQLIEQELAKELGDEDEEEEEEPDMAAELFNVFVDTVMMALQPKTSKHQLTQESFKTIVNRRVPGSLE